MSAYRLLSIVLAGAAFLGGGTASAGSGPANPNILVILVDDVGVDLLREYDEASFCELSLAACSSDADCPESEACLSDYATTPNIDQLRQQGLLFRNAWAAPRCRPTRATILTGRYGSRTGVLGPGGTPLPHDELTLPEVLRDPVLNPQVDYADAIIGKWHLGGGEPGPNDHGFSHFAGALGNLSDHFAWDRTVDGRTTLCGPGSLACPGSSYTVTVQVDDALTWIGQQTGPWFLYLAFSSVHLPWQVPPHELISLETLRRLPRDASMVPVPAGTTCVDDERRVCLLAMLEAVDTEIGRLLASLTEPTTIVVVGDNGTSATVTAPPFDPNHAKGTLFEGGVNVPLILVDAAGRAAGEETSALVHTVDLFSTVLDLVGANPPDDRTIDGTSLLPLLDDPSADLRPRVYTERLDRVAMRDSRYKLIRATGRDSLFDLTGDPPATTGDPFETVDLLQGVCSVTVVGCHIDQHCPLGQSCNVPPFPAGGEQALDAMLLELGGLFPQTAGEIPARAGLPGEPLRMLKLEAGMVLLTWDESCSASDLDYAVYEGLFGDFTSHQPRFCSTNGNESASLFPVEESAYYLVVPTTVFSNGSFGRSSAGEVRPAGPTTCKPLATFACD